MTSRKSLRLFILNTIEKRLFYQHFMGDIMESLEERIARLTPERRREVEDFVDFLLLKSNLQQAPVTAPACPALMNTPPLMIPEPAPVPVPGPAVNPSALPVPGISTDITPSPAHEISAGDDDRLTHDYMDYGNYDENPSLATEAVKKVKQKIIARQENDKPDHLLDWVD
jgi:hypothetical protein